MFLSKSLKLFAVLLTLASLHGEELDPGKAVQSLIDAELNYNKLAQEKDFAAASVQVFAGDGVVFAPGVLNGKKFWSKQTEPPILTWRPSFATIARSGDLGYTTGPWELRKAKGDTKPEAFGHYNTMWRKGADGVWSVTSDPLEPTVHLYFFTVDGQAIADPINPRMKLRASITSCCWGPE